MELEPLHCGPFSLSLTIGDDLPRYDYTCQTCGRTFERRTASGDRLPDRLACESCGGSATRQFPRRTQFRMGADPYEAAYKRGEFDIP